MGQLNRLSTRASNDWSRCAINSRSTAGAMVAYREAGRTMIDGNMIADQTLDRG
jgi:hypothetical protein